MAYMIDAYLHRFVSQKSPPMMPPPPPRAIYRSPRLSALPVRVLEEPQYFEPGKRRPTPIPNRKREQPVIVRLTGLLPGVLFDNGQY